MMVPHRGHGTTLTAPHAWRSENPVIPAHGPAQAVDQTPCARKLATEPVAYPHGDAGRRLSVVPDYVEMSIEGSDLEDFGLGQSQALGQGANMPRRDMAESILDFVKIFDQQVAPQRFLSEGGSDLLQ